ARVIVQSKRRNGPAEGRCAAGARGRRRAARGSSGADGTGERQGGPARSGGGAASSACRPAMIRERRARSRPRRRAAARRRARRRWAGPPGRSAWRAPRWSGGGHRCRRAGEGPGGGRARPPGRGGTAGTAVLRREMCGSAQWCGGAPIPIVLGVTKGEKIGIATAAAVAALVIAAAVAVTAYREKTIGFIADRIAAGSATGVIVQVTDSAGEEVWTAGEAVPGEG